MSRPRPRDKRGRLLPYLTEEQRLERRRAANRRWYVEHRKERAAYLRAYRAKRRAELEELYAEEIAAHARLRLPWED